MKEQYILGTKVHTHLTVSEILGVIDDAISSNSVGNIICTVNPEFILEALHDTEFREIINNSLLAIPDGHGVYLACEYLKAVEKLPKGILAPLTHLFVGLYVGLARTLKPASNYYVYPGADIVYSICEYAQTESRSLYLLGGWPKNWFGKMKDVDYDLAEKVSNKLKREYPKLHIIGATSQFDSKPSSDESVKEYVCNNMKETSNTPINLLLASFKHGDQEKWLKRNLKDLNINVGIGVGGAFDFLSNNVKRAPYVVRKLRLEWLFRFIAQPWRIKRVINAVCLFPLKVYLSSIKNNL